MSFQRNQRLLQTLTNGLSHEQTHSSAFFATGALRNLFSISNVTRRFYTPSITTSQLQHTSTGDSSSNASPSQNDSARLEDIERRIRPSRHTRGHYHLLSLKRPRWTDEEKDMLLRFVRQGYSSYDVHTHFPLRSICSLDTRIAHLRTEEQKKGTIVKKPRLSIQKLAWGVKEDEWLLKRLEEYGFKKREEMDVSWPEIANGTVNGKKLGRTATSCKRRWAIIDPSSERLHGIWSKEELERLEKAVRSQLPDLASVAAETKADSTVVLNKLGLPVHGDHMMTIDWDEVSKAVATRSGVQCRSHAHKTLASGVEGKWNTFEIERLVKGVDDYGHDWHKVAAVIGTRSAFQTRQKYFLMVAKKKAEQKEQQKQ
ncbi:hypothetical protein EC957_006121 [Mortierella hygrophila]|uniref:Uncharacterized protein n=1 Tax=Mortierella hygrophila TaxID=979708 RepID=A0A9P6FER6_9FUNG|nr:hypothetical protein EC957_006121 [Mortierella hygrophila]